MFSTYNTHYDSCQLVKSEMGDEVIKVKWLHRRGLFVIYIYVIIIMIYSTYSSSSSSSSSSTITHLWSVYIVPS